MEDRHHQPIKPRRRYTLDILRGIAVFLMILAHSIDFYFDSSHSYPRGIVAFINTIAFTTFLFISGAVAFIAYLNHTDYWQTVKKRLKYRLWLLLCSYYILALISVADKLVAFSPLQRWKLVGEIIVFKNIPAYLEFIIPFLIYASLLIIFKKSLLKILSKFSYALSFSLLIYLVGALLYYVPSPTWLSPFKALILGDNNSYRFPILQYTPVYLMGLFWGKWLLVNPENYLVKKQVLKITLWLILIATVILSVSMSLNAPQKLLFWRWPPSILFLLSGGIFVFLSYYLISVLNEFRKHHFLRDILLLFGQNSFALFWTHIFLLKLFQFSNGTMTSSILILIALFLILLITSLALATFIPFNFAFHLTFIRDYGGGIFSKPGSHLPPVYHIVEDIHHRPHLLRRAGFFIYGILGFLAVLAIFGFNREPSVAKLPEDEWWNHSYAYSKSLTIINNQPFAKISKRTPISLNLDHRLLVKEKKSLISGDDVKLIYYLKNHPKELPYRGSNWNTDSATLTFLLPGDIGAGKKSANYFIYYGNNIARKTNAHIQGKMSVNAKVVLGEEKSHPIIGNVSKVWVLKQKVNKEPLVFTLKNNSYKVQTSARAYYMVNGTKLRGSMDPVDTDSWEILIDPADLPVGKYTIRGYLKDGNENIYSQDTGFIVSNPLYVTWTIDWEGYDVAESYLQAMEKISRDHQNLPMTQLFNPRVFTSSQISSKRASYLTKWVKNRKNYHNDAIGMHLHMFKDYAKDAGLSVREEPRWGNSQDGYDVPTTAYNYDETLQLLIKGKQLLEKRGLGTPLSYRAGGWFADEDTLRAIQDAGFRVDTSGRTKYSFGTRNIKGPWDLTATTHPYYPSVENQNSSGPNHLSILEIPNNGADSYWFSAKDMIARFKANYSCGLVTEKQQVTYLSHPHWFNSAEQKRIDSVFEYTDQFLNNLDLGPVVYVTTDQVYEEWTIENE